MNKGVSKGEGLTYLCKKLKVDKSQVIAIGDNENDLSMLNFAGLGVAMGNSRDEIKNMSDYVTSSNNEEGVAKVIEKYILGDEN
jgi:hydroxymethylpyrimidine pyrophosphatase-like HAD family hydrolase